jgi:hypothetical protein
MMLRDNDAVISACGRYRYVLTRRLGGARRTATFILLNPSTADAMRDDPTIRRCLDFARRWRCGRLVVLNLFALRATNPAELKRAPDPVGPDNAVWFAELLRECDPGPVVCGWGVHGALLGQDEVVLTWMADAAVRPRALGVTAAGHPRHPLYVPYSARLIRITRVAKTREFACAAGNRCWRPVIVHCVEP